jgi:hypothetical protein
MLIEKPKTVSTQAESIHQFVLTEARRTTNAQERFSIYGTSRSLGTQLLNRQNGISVEKHTDDRNSELQQEWEEKIGLIQTREKFQSFKEWHTDQRTWRQRERSRISKRAKWKLWNRDIFTLTGATSILALFNCWRWNRSRTI